MDDAQLFAPLNRQKLVIASLPPPENFWARARKQFLKSPTALLGLVLLTFIISMTYLAPYLSPYEAHQTALVNRNQPPSTAHWFGTDDLGRDVFIRTWQGARISLFVASVAACVDLIIGLFWGGVAALAGGKIDEMMMRIADILYGLPYLLVVILLMVVLGSGIFPIIIALTLTGWINMARIVRGQMISLKEADYVAASRTFGAGFFHILRRHLIPNTMGPIIVTLTLTIPVAIFVEAFLSFLGLGIQPPQTSWGNMASEGLPALRYYPWRIFFPALFISLSTLSFNLIGDALRDCLDPRLKL